MSTLVIRLSSLGDVVLTGAVTGALAPVTFLTHPRYREVAAILPGVERVLALGEDTLPQRADRIVDLHASPRSRWLSLQVRGPVWRVQRHDLRRRLRVALKWGAPPPSVVERYAAAARVQPDLRPWVPRRSDGSPEALLLCPGAAHATKQWPPERFAQVGRRWGGPVILLAGPGEEARLARTIADAIGSRAEVIAERGFQGVLAALGRGRAALGGDTGLTHLCAASGVPTVGVFGPTTAADGFWVYPGPVAELSGLPCRPCARYGGPRCPIGDHLCMTGLSVDQVWETLRGVLCAGSS